MNTNIKEKFMLAIYLSFSIDSAAKVIIDSLRIHIGLFLLLFLSIVYIALKPRYAFTTLTRDPFLLVVFIFISVHSAYAIDLKSYLIISAYFIISATIYLYISSNINKINIRLISSASILILLAGGLSQYVLSNFFNYPLVFGGIDIDYYIVNPNFEKRMRGFFLEPNWFGLILLFWSCAYLYSLREKKQKLSKLLFFLVTTVGLQYLSGNRLTLILQIHLTLAFFAQTFNYRQKSIFFNPTTLLISAFLLYIFSTFIFSSALIESDRSAVARIATLSNVMNFFSSRSYEGILFGYGFSNWGSYSNEYFLSFSNFRGEQSLVRRDNAEFYVILFETGLFGLAILLLDFLRGKRIESKQGTAMKHYTLALAYFYICALFYPVYTFIIYCVPLIILRAKVYASPQKTGAIENAS